MCDGDSNHNGRESKTQLAALEKKSGIVMSSPTNTAMSRQQAPQLHDLSRQLWQPGEDGYRTPVIEDAEHPAHHRSRQSRSAHPPSSPTFHPIDHRTLQDPVSSPEQRSRGEKSHHSHEPGRCHLPDGLPKSLTWKQRIKHVSWAYFTLTMATGGIKYLSQVADRVTETDNIKVSRM